ncbi:MAG: 6-pyruvoyl-tetrahydropterin synthase-related protein, partial [Acidobacteriota bacterium]|nr:6-pyruvoyl-tetrahydropterin synthase-related protein [Acidobacteriota bacterium]
METGPDTSGLGLAGSIDLEPSQDHIPTRVALRRSFAINESQAILIVALVGVAIMVPIMVWGIPSGGDLANHYRFALPFYDSIRGGRLYPGWLAESNYGFGDARFRFYPPGLYYLLALFKLVTGWYWSSMVALTGLTVLGGLGTYFWARGSYPVKVAMWAGMLYTIAPYHLNELYQASLLSEYAACAVLPFVFAFVERICRRQRTGDIAGLAASYALLVLTHLPLTVIGSLSVLVYVIFLLRRKGLWSILAQLTIGGGLGLAASAFFWTTMLAELPWIKGNSAHQNIYYDYRANFLFSPGALTNRNTWYANLLALAVLGMLLPAVILLAKREGSRATKAVALLTVVSFLMATELSRPLWPVIPKLREVQFPWRWLAITSLGGSVLLASSVPHWINLWRRSFRPLQLVPVLGVVLSLGFIATQIVWDSEYLPRHEFDSLMTSIRGSASFKDWMPVWASESAEIYLMKERVNADPRAVTITSWEPEHRVFTIGSGQQGEVR